MFLVCIDKKKIRFTHCKTGLTLRDSPTRFLTSSFFHHLNQPRPLTNGLKYSILVMFSPSYSNFFESPRGMILRRVNLPGVKYPGEKYDFSISYLKGQSNEIFDMFFHDSSLPGPLSNGLKYFKFLLRFCWFIRIVRKISPGYHTASQSPRGTISYCAESLMTPGSQEPFLNTFAQAFKGTVSQK